MQEALDILGDILDKCNRRWYRALAALPIYGEEIDREVARFVQVCRDVALGNLDWRFVSLPLSLSCGQLVANLFNSFFPPTLKLLD